MVSFFFTKSTMGFNTIFQHDLGKYLSKSKFIWGCSCWLIPPPLQWPITRCVQHPWHHGCPGGRHHAKYDLLPMKTKMFFWKSDVFAIEIVSFFRGHSLVFGDMRNVCWTRQCPALFLEVTGERFVELGFINKSLLTWQGCVVSFSTVTGVTIEKQHPYATCMGDLPTWMFEFYGKCR